MTDESHSFTAAKTRLEEIVTQVRKKDTSLEKSLDLLEEGVRLANVCTEMIDQTDWNTPPTAETGAVEHVVEPGVDGAPDAAIEDTSAPAEADVEQGSREDAPVTDGGEDTPESAVVVGEVWSDDEAWADEDQDDPSDGDDGHGA